MTPESTWDTVSMARENPYRLSANMRELLADCRRTDPEPMYVHPGKWERTARALKQRGMVDLRGFQPLEVYITPLGRGWSGERV